MEKVRLGDVCIINGGYAFKSDRFSTEGVPIIRIGNITKDGLIIDEDVCYNENFWNENESYRIQKNDIVIAMSGATVGKSCINTLERKLLLNQRVATINCDNKTNLKYIFYSIGSENFAKYIGTNSIGCAQPNISLKQISNFEIPVVCEEEQKRIVYEFDKLTDLIDKRKQQLEKLDELVKSRFVEMFGDININNKKWKSQPLGELCTIVRGGSPRPIEQFLGGDVPWIKIGDATDGDSIYLNSTKEHIIQEGVKKSRLVKAGNLIFANCGVSLGFARIITFDGCIHDGWLAIEDIDERLNKVFLLQTLNQMTEHFRAIAPAGTQPNLNTTIMKAYMQIVPPIELQKEYVSFLEQTDKAKFEIKQSLEKLELLKKALMQKYFG